MNSERIRTMSGPGVRAVGLLLLLALVAAAFPVSSVSAATCKFRYNVQPGDTLIYVGALYQVDWRDIAEANNLGEPYVISAGQRLCIPGGVKPDGTTTTTTTTSEDSSTEPALVVVPDASHVLVSVENFAPKTSYFVNIFPRSYPVSYRLGQKRTNKEGDFTEWFRIPNYVPRTYEMAVCVKNTWTDAVTCVKYQDPYYALLMLVPRCNVKKSR